MTTEVWLWSPYDKHFRLVSMCYGHADFLFVDVIGSKLGQGHYLLSRSGSVVEGDGELGHLEIVARRTQPMQNSAA